MTNAEKLAKDTDFMVRLISFFYCESKDKCSECPLEISKNGCAMVSLDSEIRQWLESEVEEDAEIH